jgi:hypothetical protein
MEQVFTVLGWAVLLTLSLGIARQLSSQPTIYQFPDSFGSLYSSHGWDKGAMLENFEDQQLEVKPTRDDTGSSCPGPVSPAGLLLPDQPSSHPGNLTAESCYKNDFLAQTEKTGNYIQRTNNFRHAKPDSCTTPLTEFVNSFYS